MLRVLGVRSFHVFCPSVQNSGVRRETQIVLTLYAKDRPLRVKTLNQY